MYVVSDMEDPMKMFEDSNMMEYLYEEESKSTAKEKMIDLALTRYMDREEKLKKR